MIYWANDVYPPFFPDWFYEFLHLEHRLAFGMAVHFTAMWLFTLNGILYVSYLLISGEWREIVPRKNSWRDAWKVTLSELGLRKNHPPQTGRFNAAQRIAYSGIILVGIGSVFTGLSIYKPVQLHPLASAFAGYEGARFFHFAFMLLYLIFFVIHVAQVVRAGWNHFKTISLAYGFVLVFGAAGVFLWAASGEKAAGISPTLRRVLEWNGIVGSQIYQSNRVPLLPAKPPFGKEPRVNGDLGLSGEVTPDRWKMDVYYQVNGKIEKKLTLSLADLRWLPKTDTVTEFKCIEGWSEVMAYAGVKFSDFLSYYHLGKETGPVRDSSQEAQSLFRYVGLETPDRKYYVSLDMDSMLHPQTVLAYEMNGVPLKNENGAPLRLVAPIKYGIKSLKRIGAITFSDVRLPDYWAERGYDWYSGL
jgi:thiosulfate reductase cytochrome b subunit